jgi:hypothetical protein
MLFSGMLLRFYVVFWYAAAFLFLEVVVLLLVFWLPVTLCFV